MPLKFTKYQGTGNDFIIIDNRTHLFKPEISLIQLLCDRKFGIGSDGLILIENSAEADFEMVFYNPDGSQSFCGNGSRCAVNFAHTLGIIQSKGTFKAIDGTHDFLVKPAYISIKMNEVHEIFSKGEDYFVDTGSPHYVRFIEDINSFDIVPFGRHIRYSPEFEHINGTNVNVVEVVDKNTINIATYERGVENETLSCGTGVTACALVHGIRSETDHVAVNTKGGSLVVSFERSGSGFDNIFLNGPAEMVFEGVIDPKQLTK